MQPEQWTENIYRFPVQGKTEGDLLNGYLVLATEHDALVIDVPSTECAKNMLLFLKKLGYDPQHAIKYIILTHAHPYTLVGVPYLLKKTRAKIVAQANAKPLFEKEWKEYVFKRMFPIKGLAAKISLAFKTDMFSALAKLNTTPYLIEKEDTIELADYSFFLTATKGHTEHHMLIYAVNDKATFIGDELHLIPTNYYSFYIDATGSLQQRTKILQLLKKMKNSYLFPLHGTPITQQDIEVTLLQLDAAQQHLEQTVYDVLMSITEAKTTYIAEQVSKILSINWKTPYKELNVLNTTIEAVLNKLKDENKVTFDYKSQRWKLT